MTEFWKNFFIGVFIGCISSIIATLIATYSLKDAIKIVIEHMDCITPGMIDYYTGNEEKGHDCVARALATDYGLAKHTRKWLVDACKESPEKCEDCKYWTCPGKENRK